MSCLDSTGVVYIIENSARRHVYYTGLYSLGHFATTLEEKLNRKRFNSDTGNRTPGYRVRGDNVSHYTISDVAFVSILVLIYAHSSLSRELGSAGTTYTGMFNASQCSENC